MVMVPPFMHGAAQWASFIMMHSGVKIVVPDENRRMDPGTCCARSSASARR
jgi:fatty-acyl-CoA synthase